jgi:hypothetical protein
VITSRTIHNRPLLDEMRRRPPIDLSSRRGEDNAEPETLCQNSDVAIFSADLRNSPFWKKGNRIP